MATKTTIAGIMVFSSQRQVKEFPETQDPSSKNQLQLSNIEGTQINDGIYRHRIITWENSFSPYTLRGRKSETVQCNGHVNNTDSVSKEKDTKATNEEERFN